MSDRLAEYGIQTEESDFRIHVGFGTRHVVCFERMAALMALRTGLELGALRAKVGGQPHVKGQTYKGYPVPCQSIEGCQVVVIPLDLWWHLGCDSLDRQKSSTTEKGDLAVLVAHEMIRAGLITIPLTTLDVEDVEMQIRGVDIVMGDGPRIQVKCDWLAGPALYGGTGRVFLQVRERNPRKQY